MLKTTWSKDSEKVKANNEELREVKKRDLPTSLVGQRNIDRYVRTTPSHLSSLVDHFFFASLVIGVQGMASIVCGERS